MYHRPFHYTFQIPDNIMVHLENLAPQLRMELTDLIELMSDLADSMQDAEFVKQVLDINNSITEMSADN